MEIKKLNYGWGVKLAVLLIICVQYTVTITSPILGTIMEAFRNTPAWSSCWRLSPPLQP